MEMDRLAEKNYKKLWEMSMILCGRKYYKCVMPMEMGKYPKLSLLIFWSRNIIDP